MTKPMTPAQWKSQLKKWGVRVVYLDGWDKRGRPDSTAGGPLMPNGAMVHHTGSDSQTQDYIDWLFKTGRPAEGIPAPLANVMTMMDGRLIMGAVGKANHAGKGVQKILTEVIAETISMTEQEKPGGVGTVNGNPRFYGNEVAYDGGQPMTAAQYDTVVRWCAAICDFHDWTAASVIGHGEWTSAKWDPGKTDMAKLRRDVAALLKAGPGGEPDPTPPKPKKTQKVSSAVINLAGAKANTHGVKTAKARVARYVKARTNVPVSSILAQEVNLDMLAQLDRDLPGFQPAVGGHGRYVWVGEGRPILDHGCDTAPAAYKDDTKQMAWAAYEVNGVKVCDGSMHLEHRDGSTPDQIRVKQAVWFADLLLAHAKANKVPLGNVMLAGDTNSEGMVLAALVAKGWRHVAPSDPDAYTFFGWDGRARKRFDYVLVYDGDGAVPVKAEFAAMSRSTDLSDHASIRVVRYLPKP